MELLESYISISPPVPSQPPPFKADRFQTISEVRSQLKQNDSTLSLLKSQLEWISKTVAIVELRMKEYEVQGYFLRGHARTFNVCSIEDLPSEVLNIIFDFCLKDVLPFDARLKPRPFHGNRYSFDKAPWTLSRVCSSWRMIVHNTSSLWRNLPGPIDVFSTDFELSYYNNNHILAGAFRYGLPSSMLHMALDCGWASNDRDGARVCGGILAVVPRIQALALRCSNSGGLWRLRDIPLSEIPPQGFASLTSLSLQVWTDQDYYDDRQREILLHGSYELPPLLHSMPKLEELSIHSPERIVSDADLTELKFPWNQLTSLTIHDVSMSLVYNLLSTCPLLIQLRASDIGENDEDVTLPLQKQLEHTNLQLLHLHCRSPAVICRHGTIPSSTNGVASFLKTLILPNLKQLSLVHDEPFGKSAISDFIMRSQCSLVELEYSGANPHTSEPSAEILSHLGDTADISSVLLLCPSLTKLTLDEPAGVNWILSLSSPIAGNWLVPRLETLVLRLPRTRGTWLEELVEARKAASGVQDLRRIEIIAIDPTWTEFTKYDTALSWSEDVDEILPSEVSGALDDAFELASNVLFRAQSGYELLNNQMSMEKLSHLCTHMQSGQQFFDREKRYMTWKTLTRNLFADLLKIYEYINDVDAIEQHYPAGLEHKIVLQQILQQATDPWLFEAPPMGWTRVKIPKTENDVTGHNLLVYTAPSR